jgi:hypothetical protein
MRPASRIGLVLALVMGLALPAFAVDVYVNGERVTGVGNLTIQSPSSVRFDAQGNVFIDAPNYRVQAVLPAPAPRPLPATSPPDVPRLGRRYFLVTDTNAPGHVQYDVAVTINGQVVRRVESDEPQVILNVTEFLRPGTNAVSIAAFKDLTGGRRGTSNGEVFRVLIGEGHEDGGGHVTLETQSVVFVVDASQTDPVSRQYQLSAR